MNEENTHGDMTDEEMLDWLFGAYIGRGEFIKQLLEHFEPASVIAARWSLDLDDLRQLIDEGKLPAVSCGCCDVEFIPRHAQFTAMSTVVEQA